MLHQEHFLVIHQHSKNFGELKRVLYKIVDHRLLLREVAIEAFLENSCTFYDREIILLNIVLLRSSLAQMPKLPIKGIYEKLGKLEKSNPIRYVAGGGKNKKTKFCCI